MNQSQIARRLTRRRLSTCLTFAIAILILFTFSLNIYFLHASFTSSDNCNIGSKDNNKQSTPLTLEQSTDSSSPPSIQVVPIVTTTNKLSSNRNENIKPRHSLHPSPLPMLTAGDEKFKQLLESHTTSVEKAVILAMVSRQTSTGGFNFAELWLDQWVCSLRRIGLDKNFVLIAVDQSALEFAEERGYPAILASEVTTLERMNESPQGGWIRYVRSKPMFALAALKLGYNVLWSDLDVVFFSDPFPLFAQDKSYDVMFSYEGPYNTGLYFVRSTAASEKAMTEWTLRCLETTDDTTHDQHLLNMMRSELDWKLLILPLILFPNGCVIRRNFRIPPESLYTFHINCIWGAEEKMNRTKQYGLWLVRSETQAPEDGSDEICIEDPGWPQVDQSSTFLIPMDVENSDVFVLFARLTHK